MNINADLLFQENKNKEWFLEVFTNIAPYESISFEDRNRLLAIYGIVNNDITGIKKYLHAINDPTDGMFKASMPDLLENEDIFYNRIYPKYMFHLGQMKKMVPDFEIIPIGDYVSEFKDEEYYKYVSNFVDNQQRDLANNPEGREEILARKPDTYDNFVSSIETFYTNVKEYFFSKFNVNEIKSLIGQHILSASRIYAGIEYRNGELVPIVYNTINCNYSKSHEKSSVSKADYFYNQEAVTLVEAYAEIAQHGTDADLKLFRERNGIQGNRPRKEWDIRSAKSAATLDYSMARYQYGVKEGGNKRIGQATGDQEYKRDEDRIWRREFKVKAFRKVKFYSYVNQYGKSVCDLVDKDFPIPKDATMVYHEDEYNKKTKRYEWVDEFGNNAYVEEVYVTRVYTGVLYDYDILIKYGEYPFQGLDGDLPVVGKIFSNLNSKSISLVERGLPSQMIYNYVKKLQVRELSKYLGLQEEVDAAQIPDFLTKDENGQPLVEGMDNWAIYHYFQRVLGKSISDSNANKLGIPTQGTRPRASNFTLTPHFVEIVNMQNFLELIDREIGIQMLVPPQAEGQIQPYTTSSDNQRVLQQAFIMASEYYEGMVEVMKDLVNEYIKQFKLYYQRYFEEHPDNKEVNLNYIVPNGSRKVLKIIPEYLDHEDLGLFVKSTSENEEYRQIMTQFGLQALAQNRGEGAETISLIAKAIVRNESPEEIHKMIVIAGKQQQEFLKQVEAQKQQIQVQLEQQKGQELAAELQNKLDVVDLKGRYDLKKEEIKANEDQDGVSNDLENIAKAEDIESKRHDRSVKDRELAIKERGVSTSS